MGGEKKDKRVKEMGGKNDVKIKKFFISYLAAIVFSDFFEE